MGAGEEANKRARLSIERYGKPVGKYDKYIKSNSTIINNNYIDLYSNYITSILNTNYILLTIQWTSRRERNTSLAIKRNTLTKKSTSIN